MTDFRAMADFSAMDNVLGRYFDGTASAADVDALEQRLAHDSQFADHVARQCLLNRQISDLLTEHKLHALIDQFSTSVPSLPKAAQTEWRERTGGGGTNQRHRNWRRAGAAIAAALLLASSWWFLEHSTPSDVLPPVATFADQELIRGPENPAVAATLTKIVNGSWSLGAQQFKHGELLHVGDRLALDAGMIKVTYDCGAEVVLQGPCEFFVHSPMVGYLKRGKITANVPRRAFSFAILSPQVDMVDLGTSFGVEVGGNGRTELHVFEGEVLCSEPATQTVGQRNEVIHVMANTALEFGAAAGRPSDIAMNEASFARLIDLRRPANSQTGHPPNSKLALWLAADVAVTTDTQQRVVSWQDIVGGDNASGEDAIQIEEQSRPRLVENAIHGKPAVRFDGDSDFLLTTPLETTDDQTVLFVCQFGPQTFQPGRKWGGQIINYDGPPNRYLSNTLEPGVLQIGEPLLEAEFKPSLLTGQVFAGFIGSATVESGRIDGRTVGRDTPVVVAYVYDYEYGQGRSYLAVNGKQLGEARAFAPQGITSRKIIGRHAWMDLYFGGDLGEMLIYNKALDSQELAATTAYLADKYQIKLDK